MRFHSRRFMMYAFMCRGLSLGQIWTPHVPLVLTRTPSKSSERWIASFATMDVDVRIARNCFLWACLPSTAVKDCHQEHVQLWIVWLTPIFFLSLSQQFMEFNHFVCLLLRDIIWFVEVFSVLLEIVISSFRSCDNDCESSKRWFCCFGFLLL